MHGRLFHKRVDVREADDGWAADTHRRVALSEVLGHAEVVGHVSAKDRTDNDLAQPLTRLLPKVVLQGNDGTHQARVYTGTYTSFRRTAAGGDHGPLA